MQRIVNPKQSRLFDPFDPVLTAKTRARLLDDWPGVFRHVILELMPVDTLGGHYSADLGRPTKELYSMAGLIFMMEFFNWKKPAALNAYSFHMDVHYALNMEPVAHDIAIRTLERYIVLFEKDDLAKQLMHDVTITLAELLEINVDKQRLDSTHIFSDMANFGRTRLMGVAIKRFLTQVLRGDPDAYKALPEALRQRYRPSVHQMFGDTGKDKESRRLLRQQVAEDMHFLIGHFADSSPLNNGTCYKAMERIFYEQCEVHEEKVTVKEKTGSRVMQNPSDPDATYDGHKGPGYQVQLSETCDPDNEVQLITSALPQTAAESDAEAVEPVLNDLEASDLLPQELLVDTGYASDENVQKAESRGVELVGPVPGSGGPASGDELTIDDFNIDEATEQVVCCPAGHKPVSSRHDPQTGKTRTVMPDSACSACDYYDQCPAAKKRNGYQLDHTAKQRRTASRRCEEATDVFRERYKVRGGIEGTNSGVKRRTGLGHLRVRGRPRVFHAIYLKVAGWNILRASACAKMREIVHQRAANAVLDAHCIRFSRRIGQNITIRGPVLTLKPLRGDFARFFRLPAAA
jgi:hypothetical protein